MSQVEAVIILQEEPARKLEELNALTEVPANKEYKP